MKPIWRYVITLLAGFAGAALIAWNKDIFAQTDPQKIFHILSDAFCVIGVVEAGFGALIFVSNEGMFDVVVYGFQNFLAMFRKEYKKKYATFYDYRVSREGKKTKFGFMLICGCFFMVITVIMYLLYRHFS